MNKDIELIKDLFVDITDDYRMIDCSLDRELKSNGISYYIKPFVEEYGNVIKGFTQFEKNLNDIVIMIKVSPDVVVKLRQASNLLDRLHNDLHKFISRCSRHGFKYKISSSNDRKFGYYYTIILSRNELE